MELYLKALSAKLPDAKKDAAIKLDKIENLRQQLVKEGYQPSEADHFVKMSAGSAKISEMDIEQLDDVIEKLEAQINVARKCKNLFG